MTALAPQVRGAGEHRYRFGVSRPAQDALRRPLWHAIDRGPAEWPHRGRLEYVRLETLLERFIESEEPSRACVMLTRREASTLLGWITLQTKEWEARGADYPRSVDTLVPRLEYMLGLRREIPGRVPGMPELTPRYPEE